MRPEPPLPGSDEWLRFQALIHLALDQLRELVGLRALGASNNLDAEGALWSAYSSFQRQSVDFEGAKSPEELAAELLRVAKNRAQRRRRGDKQTADQVSRGTTRGPDGQPIPLDYKDFSPSPPEVASDNELIAYVREAVNLIMEELERQGDNRKCKAFQAHVAGRSQQDIASELGVNQCTVSRWLERIYDRIRQMLEENGIE